MLFALHTVTLCVTLQLQLCCSATNTKPESLAVTRHLLNSNQSKRSQAGLKGNFAILTQQIHVADSRP